MFPDLIPNGDLSEYLIKKREGVPNTDPTVELSCYPE
jgi:hypothetical protein